ncbi:hypothetical protein F5X98DRAFT_381193 [Xylaria grammica]|nr:hypothetical protein F5X98DRAFT_381193 [Xylaria grammica]
MQLKLFLNLFLATVATAGVVAPIPDGCSSGDDNLVRRVPVPLDARNPSVSPSNSRKW